MLLDEGRRRRSGAVGYAGWWIEGIQRRAPVGWGRNPRGTGWRRLDGTNSLEVRVWPDLD